MGQLLDSFSILCVLHLKDVVILDKISHLVLHGFSINLQQLVFETSVLTAFNIDGLQTTVSLG